MINMSLSIGWPKVAIIGETADAVNPATVSAIAESMTAVASREKNLFCL